MSTSSGNRRKSISGRNQPYPDGDDEYTPSARRHHKGKEKKKHALDEEQEERGQCDEYEEQQEHEDHDGEESGDEQDEEQDGEESGDEQDEEDEYDLEIKELLEKWKPPAAATSLEDAAMKLPLLAIPHHADFNAFPMQAMLVVHRILLFLQSCAEQGPSDQRSKCRLFPYAICYKDATSRDNAWTRWLTSTNKNLDDGEEQMIMSQFTQDRFYYKTVGEAFSASKPVVGGDNCLYLACSSDHPAYGQSWQVKMAPTQLHNEEARQKHQSTDLASHAAVVSMESRNMFIYDPSFDQDQIRTAKARGKKNTKGKLPEKRPRLSELTTLQIPRYMRDWLVKNNRRHYIKDVVLGGGGNIGHDECLHMALARIRDYIAWSLAMPDVINPEPEDAVKVDV